MSDLLRCFDSHLITSGWKAGGDFVPNERISCSVSRWNTCLGTLELEIAVGITKTFGLFLQL